MKLLTLFLSFLIQVSAVAMVRQTVYVESPTDTDGDGKKDLIYVTIDRDANQTNQPVMYKITPYALGGNSDAPMHSTDVELLPQDIKSNKKDFKTLSGNSKSNIDSPKDISFSNYAKVNAHSVGTGYSTGCPTVGDINETLAAKAVIDWLNGQAKAYTKAGDPVVADWASGDVGMMGVSYNGTLPTMVASTGVKGLKAIVPIAAISNWYDYYRSNGLVVNPGGYIGEDADVLGKFIVRRNTCGREISDITRNMGRESGDYTNFWKERDFLPMVKNIKAATFIVHGQSDWNVKQKHAIQLWEALPSSTPKRMFLHSGAHSNPRNSVYRRNVEKWFDQYVRGIETDIESQKPIRVQSMNSNKVIEQMSWPHESTSLRVIGLGTASAETIIDEGKNIKVKELLRSPDEKKSSRLIFLSPKLNKETLISGTSKINLSFSLTNRRAANLTVVLVDYGSGSFNSSKIITRGWADAQNHQDIAQGELLELDKKYKISFPIEPKQYKLKAGHRLGVLITSTDYSYTLRPDIGTKIQVYPSESSIELFIDNKEFGFN